MINCLASGTIPKSLQKYLVVPWVAEVARISSDAKLPNTLVWQPGSAQLTALAGVLTLNRQ